jgi:hypothetical protein
MVSALRAHSLQTLESVCKVEINQGHMSTAVRKAGVSLGSQTITARFTKDQHMAHRPCHNNTMLDL